MLLPVGGRRCWRWSRLLCSAVGGGSVVGRVVGCVLTFCGGVVSSIVVGIFGGGVFSSVLWWGALFCGG